MDAAFWLERWDKKQIGFHQQDFNPYLQTYWATLQVPREAAVFVPMCGKSRDMQWLRERGHRVIGVELARVAVEEFFQEQSLTPRIDRIGSLERWEGDGYTLWCGDLFQMAASHLDGVEAVFDRASLIALPVHMRADYVRQMTAIVPVEAQTLLISLTYSQQQMKGPPFSVDEFEIRRLYAGYRIEKLADVDILWDSENARFRERGLTAMSEQVYRVTRGAQGV
jgi:thiopurine S-methyltransferase